MTTKEAFRQMMFNSNVWKTLGISPARIKYFRHRIKNKLQVETDKMEELLLKAGYIVVQEKKWKK